MYLNIYFMLKKIQATCFQQNEKKKKKKSVYSNMWVKSPLSNRGGTVLLVPAHPDNIFEVILK